MDNVEEPKIFWERDSTNIYNLKDHGRSLEITHYSLHKSMISNNEYVKEEEKQESSFISDRW